MPCLLVNGDLPESARLAALPKQRLSDQLTGGELIGQPTFTIEPEEGSLIGMIRLVNAAAAQANTRTLKPSLPAL